MATAKTKMRSKAAAAPKPPSRKPEDEAQYERFREFARDHETNDDPEAFDGKFREIVPSRPRP